LWGDDLKGFTCLFDGKSTREEVLTTNGNYIIDDLIISDKITEGLNDKFDYQCTVIVDKEKSSELYNLFIEGSIIRVSDEFGDEVFRICNVRKNKRDIEIYARQITISDTLTLWLEDVRPTTQSGTSAIQYIFNGAKGKNEIIATSNITKVNTAYYMYMNVYKALFDNDNSFLERWGGEIYRNKYNLAINNRVGQDKDIVIQSKKNLTGFEIKTNIDSLCTIIYPVGFDGIKANRIISPFAGNYPREFFKEIKYEDVKLKTENDPDGYNTLAEAQTELKRRAELEFSKNHIDIITAEYNINFVELYKTEEYKNYGLIEYVGIGDTITVKEDTYNTDIRVRVVEREYSPKLDKRLSTKLSNKDIKLTPPTISQIVAELDNAQKKGVNGLGDYINALMNSGIKDSYVVAKQNEILIMDSKDVNTAINVVRLNRNGLGFSQNGYYGYYEYGFTIDGKINASLISTGILDANLIRTGTLSSIDGKTNFDIGNGNISSKLYDGSEVVISPSDGFYNKFGSSKNEYHHLSYTGTIISKPGEIVKIQLPDEFKNKYFVVHPTLTQPSNTGGGNVYVLMNNYWINFHNDSDYINYSKGTFEMAFGATYVNTYEEQNVFWSPTACTLIYTVTA